MVKFTSAVVAASLFAGSALAAPSFSRSDNVAITAREIREIEALFGREMVEYATRSPHHHGEVMAAVNTVGKVADALNQRREYDSPLVARDHSHTGEHNHIHHPHHYGQHPHQHNHVQPTGDAPVDAPATQAPDAGANQRREYLEARDHSHTGEHNHIHHPHHYGQHPHQHNHVQPTGDAPVDAPTTQAPDAGANQRREYLEARDHSHTGEHNHIHHPHHYGQHQNGQHPHQHNHVQPTGDAPVDAPTAQAPDAGTNQRRSYDDYYSSFVARDTTTDGSVDAGAASAAVPPAHVHHQQHQHSVHHNASPEAMHRWHEVIAKMHQKQMAQGGHHQHMHMQTGPHAHAHSHVHSHSASAPASPVTDAAAPVNPPPSRRSLDFDALYARYADFDDLD